MKNKKIASKSCTYPISCIAYPNNEQILIDSLERLQNKIPSIEFVYIFHYGEGDDKNHYHLLIRNNSEKGFQNVPSLLNYFTQPCEKDVYIKDSNGNDVLKYSEGESVCYIAMRQFIITNSLGDWYDYCLHNEEYLNGK